MQFKVGHADIEEGIGGSTCTVLRTAVRLCSCLARERRSFPSAYQLSRMQATFLIKTLDDGVSRLPTLAHYLLVYPPLSKFSQKAFIFNVQSLLTVVPALIRLESFPFLPRPLF